jgi:hypothetical protein
MTRPNCPEVAVVERCELRFLQSLYERDHCGIDEAQPQVLVSNEELSNPHVITAREFRNRQFASREIVEKRDERSGAEATSGQPIEFDNYGRWYDKRLPETAQ